MYHSKYDPLPKSRRMEKLSNYSLNIIPRVLFQNLVRDFLIIYTEPNDRQGTKEYIEELIYPGIVKSLTRETRDYTKP